MISNIIYTVYLFVELQNIYLYSYSVAVKIEKIYYGSGKLAIEHCEAKRLLYMYIYIVLLMYIKCIAFLQFKVFNMPYLVH